MSVLGDVELAVLWAMLAQGRRIEAKYTLSQVDAIVLRENAENAQRTSDALRGAALEQVFQRWWRWPFPSPTEAEKRALGLDDVLWPEQLKAAHREAEGREL